MFENEVDYRVAKWVLLNMFHDNLLTEAEFRSALVRLKDHYQSPFSELDDLDGSIGDGVIVDER